MYEMYKVANMDIKKNCKKAKPAHRSLRVYSFAALRCTENLAQSEFTAAAAAHGSSSPHTNKPPHTDAPASP
jgi:hypothetical protein